MDLYLQHLPSVIDLDAIRKADVRIGADPLGGAAVDYWGAIGEEFKLNLTVVNPKVDPAWSFMTLDWDGKIRMDCSSPYAMASLRHLMEGPRRPVRHRHGQRRRLATATASSRRDGGLMNPNHYLAAAIAYLYGGARPEWPPDAKIGKTLVSSSLIDRVGKKLGRTVVEVPVGFKWFVPGLLSGEVAFGGEESAGASFLRRDGRVWTTDKDGLILALLASEITATTGASPSALHRSLTDELGESWYARVDAAATKDQKAALGKLSAEQRPGDARSRARRSAPSSRGARKRRGDRRAQGHDGRRVVRRAAVRHRGRLQDLRRVLRLRVPPRRGAGGGQGRRVGGFGRLRRSRARASLPRGAPCRSCPAAGSVTPSQV